MVNVVIIFYLCLNFIFIYNVHCVLYPYETDVRETKTLNGLWYFKASNSIFKNNPENILDVHSFLLSEDDSDTIKMAVPSSYNDITTNSSIRDHVGDVIYWRNFHIPKHWIEDNKRIFIHFGGVHYSSFVWVNNLAIVNHVGGHIPFSSEITSAVKIGLNNITVIVNNILSNHSLPQGFLTKQHPKWYPSGFITYSQNCDYFDYAGINRPVTIFTTPDIYICDISVNTAFENDTGYVYYNITTCGGQVTDCEVLLFDKNQNIVANSSDGCSGLLTVLNVSLWWPVNSKLSNSSGYLYTLEVHAKEDVYLLPVGIRTLKWDSSSLLLNNVPVYLTGFGMHEDSDIRGRGFDNVILLRDLNLIKWLGSNSFRTSHYPYADETLNEADSMGLMVILETPACSIDNFTDELFEEHKRILEAIISHHKNRPSVIMWSLANEPRTDLLLSAPYFKDLVEITHAMDKTRPVTFVTSQSPINDKAVQFVDIICVNRYYGWYSYPGRLELIEDAVIGEIIQWYTNYSKPIIVTEYGADSYIGQHSLPARMWTEDYQVFLLNEHFKAFDSLRYLGIFIGEMIWNFIDFRVSQEYFRPGNCDKGLFTRDRQPKPAAYIVRERYHKLANLTNNDNLMINGNYKGFYLRNDISVDLV